LEIYSKYHLEMVIGTGGADVRGLLSSIRDSAALWLAEDQI